MRLSGQARAPTSLFKNVAKSLLTKFGLGKKNCLLELSTEKSQNLNLDCIGMLANWQPLEYKMSFEIRIWTVEGQENQSETCYKVNIDLTLYRCSPLIQYHLACLYLPCTCNMHHLFASFSRQLIHKNRVCFLFNTCFVFEVQYRGLVLIWVLCALKF